MGKTIIDCPREFSPDTANLITKTIITNSVILTLNRTFMIINRKTLSSHPLDLYEYMQTTIKLIPKEFITAYNLHDKIHKDFVYMEISKGIYGLPQVIILTNELLKAKFHPNGYYETSTPGLWRHKTHPMYFYLAVNDFGIKMSARNM